MADIRRNNGELLFGNKRFALLYNVQGLRYTIGRRFECRGCQGEYLFCEGDGVAEKSHCVITCGGEGQFWVKDLQGLTGRGTFINGERIESRMELKFGDYLSLGGSGATSSSKVILDAIADQAQLDADYAKLWVANRNNALDGCTTFLFQAVKEISGDGVEIESQGSDADVDLFGQGHPLKNSLVLSTIFSYLPISAVRACRLVCSNWNEEATKLFKNNAVVVFNYPKGYSVHTERSQLFSFVQEMGSVFREGRFRITLPVNHLSNCHFHCDCGCSCCGYNSCTTSNIGGNPEHKLLSDLSWFFDMDEGFPHPITKLSLKGTLRCKPGRDLFLAALQGGSQNLQDLELDMNLDFRDHEDYRSNFPQPFGVAFPSLKKLSMSIRSFQGRCPVCGMEDDWDIEFMDITKQWINSMINAAPALESLKLAAETYRCHDFAECFLSRTIAEKGFQKLNTLNLYTYNYFVLESMIKLPNLVSLTLGVSHDFEDDEGLNGVEWDEEDEKPAWTVLMQNVLEKSAESLRYLDFTIPMFFEDRGRKAIEFPILPNLKVFKLREFYPKCIAFSELGFTFAEHFPALETFCVNVSSTYGYQGEKQFFKTFFYRPGVDKDDSEDEDEDDDLSTDDEDLEPKQSKLELTFLGCHKDEEQVVKSVRWLEIQNLQEWNPAAMNRIGQLFPNAFNEPLETAKAKAVAKPKWNWSKWCFVKGFEQRPVNLKKAN